MGVRLSVNDGMTELATVETATEDDFMYFRDSIFMALEGGDFGGRFPIFMRKFFSSWESEEVTGLTSELEAIHAAFRKLPPDPPDGNWRSKLIRSGRKPETLAEVYIDKDGAPLLERLIALARLAREKRLPIAWE